MEHQTKSFKTQIQACTSCFGTGRQWKELTLPRHGSDNGTGVWKTCPTCKGERVIKVTETTTILIEPYYKPNTH